jgi:hypothetical protein
MGRVVQLALVVSLVALIGVVAWRGATLASPPRQQVAEPGPIGSVSQPTTAEPDRIGPRTAPAADASPCSSPGPALPTPTPFNGATEESTGDLGTPEPLSPADAVPLDGEGIGSGQDACTVAGPTPVIAEAPVPLLLPLTATVVMVGGVLLLRRPGRGRNRPTGKEAADGE